MSLSLQPAVTSSPVEGLSISSRDGATIQSLSFGEVLKDEEKKLQQEQETNAQSVAALLATMQPPAMKQLVTGLIKAAPEGANDPTALTVDSVQPAVSFLQPSAPLPNNSVVPQQATSAAATAQEPAKGRVANSKSAPLSAPTSQTGAAGVKNSTPLQESNSTSTSVSSQPVARSTQQGEMTTAKQQPPVTQAETSADETSQTNIPVTKVTVPQSETAPVLETDQNTLVAEKKPSQTYIPISESPQLVEKQVVPAPTLSSSASGVTKVENQVKADQQPLSGELKSNTPVEASVVAEKVAATENTGMPNAVKVITTALPQVDLPANTVLRDEPITADTKVIATAQVEEVGTKSIKNVAPVDSSEPRIPEEKVTASVQTNTPVHEATKSVGKADTVSTSRSSVDVTVHNEDAALIAENEIRTDQKVPSVNFTSDEPVSADRIPVKSTSPNIPMGKAVSTDAVEHAQNMSAGADIEVETTQSVFVTEAEPILLNQATTIANELPQTARRANAPVAEGIASQRETSPVVETKQKSTVSAGANVVDQAQIDVVDNEIPRTVSKSNISAAKVMIEQSTTVGAETKIEIDQNSFVAERVLTQVTQAEVTVGQSETNLKPVMEAKRPTQSAQPEVSVDANPQAAGKVNVPAEKTAVVDATMEGVRQPMNASVGQGEAEPIMKNRTAKAKAALDVDTATAENRLGTMNKPQVEGEAFAVVQENAPVGVQSEVAAKSARVGIRSDKKVEAKEPDLELGSTGVVAGIEKGIGNVDVVKKSSVAQVDPMAMDVIDQITNQMKVRVQSGETSVRIKLNPEKLGAIEVQMTHSALGISVSFITEQASTGQLLESQVSQLRQSLKDAGVQLANLNISQHQQPNQEGGAFKQGQQFVQNPRREIPQVETSNVERARPQRIDGLTSEIDYLV